MSSQPRLLELLLKRDQDSKPDAGGSPGKAIAWARVSTDEQQERGLSLPQQLREIREYAAQRGIEIVEEFSEAASAFQREGKRVEFRRMLGAAKDSAEVTIILVHDFSRFSRDSVRAKALVRELRDAGIEVVSLNDPVADPETVAGVYLEAITFAKNEAYSREIAFHTRKGCRANVQTRDPETGCCYKNGGQALWGYRTERLQRGVDKRGRAVLKSIWVLDDSVVAGKPVHEWVRHCLIELAGKGASLDELRDFCNGSGIPARRSAYWGISTWHALLQPSVLLEYCGYGVWNARTKRGRDRPASEWIIVENAHQGIITEDEALALFEARRRQRQDKRFVVSASRTKASPYILTGGLFKCGRCGHNMIGHRATARRYYVCGSQPYRRGMGCGPGVYVPQEAVEREVVSGLRELAAACTAPRGVTRQVNEELRRIWEEATGYDPDAAARTAKLEMKIARIRQALEDGLEDVDWANTRLRELRAEMADLAAKAEGWGGPPQIGSETIMAYGRDTERTLREGSPAERRRIVGTRVHQITLAPETLEVDISYRLPEPSIVNDLVAGAGFEPATYGL